MTKPSQTNLRFLQKKFTLQALQLYSDLFLMIALIVGVKHPALETVLKRTSLAIEANAKSLSMITRPGVNSGSESKKSSTWFSIFPVENEELVYGRWEDNIIWDSEVRSWQGFLKNL